MPLSLDNPVGDLVTFRMWEPMEPPDWMVMRERMAEVLAPMERCVFCVDWTGVMNEQLTLAEAEIAKMITADNEKLVRSGILIEPSKFMLQFNQLVIRARHPNRRIFYSAEGLVGWLDPVLRPGERETIHAFLSKSQSSA